MKKIDIVKDNRKFNKIIANNNFSNNRYFTIYLMKKETEKPKFGIAVSKKYGNSVERNYIKRIIRNLIDENKLLFPNYQDYIIMIRKNCKDANFNELKLNFNKLILRELNK